jgi:hypothetical protein
VFISIDNVLQGAPLAFATDEAGRVTLTVGVIPGDESTPGMTVTKLDGEHPRRHRDGHRASSGHDGTPPSASRNIAPLRRRAHGLH